jgi:hypothetical protein
MFLARLCRFFKNRSERCDVVSHFEYLMKRKADALAEATCWDFDLPSTGSSNLGWFELVRNGAGSKSRLGKKKP